MMKMLFLLLAGPVFACLIAARFAVAAEVTDALDTVRAIAKSHAIQLALHRIDMLRPADSAAPRWLEWQRLRMQLLAEAGVHEELLRRAAALPVQLDSAARLELYALAAQSAFALGRFAESRIHAGRALWAEGIDPVRVRLIRQLVIRSYVREGRADEAYRSMLRFQQDYRPLDRAVATLFVDALLDLGLVKEAVNWLGLLDERGATKLRLRLHTGLVSAADAIRQARAALVRDDDPRWWRIVRDGAMRQNNAATGIEAQERLLNHEAEVDVTGSVLWDSYAEFARQNANAYHLLSGDESSWLEFALRRRSEEPVVARAYMGYLARRSAVDAMRRRAQDELAAMLAASGLPRTALRVFGSWPGNASVLPVNARHVLGNLAEKLGDPGRALEYWNGAPAPIDVPLLSWDIRLSALAIRAGRADIAADAAVKLAGSKLLIEQQLQQQWLALARQLADHGQADAALTLFESVLTQIGTAQVRELLTDIAKIHESRNRPLQAADYHLRSALHAAVPDALAVESRIRAGLALARGGLRKDAREQFEWVLTHAKDPSQTAIARRELGR